jgi:hypothetical protein
LSFNESVENGKPRMWLILLAGLEEKCLEKEKEDVERRLAARPALDQARLGFNSQLVVSLVI